MAPTDAPPSVLPKSPSPVSSDEETAAPPRKRPRTQAPSRPPPHSTAKPTTSSNTLAASSTTPMASPVHRFPIQPLNRFQGASASIKRPREVAHFSYDENHEYREDESSINYYLPPQLNTDLKEGFSTFRNFEETENPHIDSLLKALASKERATGEKVDADFVTWRGMMTKILTAPFDNFAEFSMFAIRKDGTIYIEEDWSGKAAQRAAENNRPPPRWQNSNMPDHKMMTYWGYKFEVLSLLSTPPPQTPQSVIDARTKAPVSNHAQHCSIVRTSFGPHSLLLGGEVDGLSGPKPPPPSSPTLDTPPTPWIELKTAEELPRNPAYRDILKFERKLLKFWAQSFLLGVPKIIVGWRSKMGILTGIQEFETAKIPGMVRRGTACWDGNVCINFAAEFLGWLKEKVEEGGGVYRIELRKKGSEIEVQRVGEGMGGIISREFEAWRGQMADMAKEKVTDEQKEGV